MRFWRKAFSWSVQLLFLGTVIYGVTWLAGNTVENLARQGTASGFGFLDSRAGFGISQTLIDYSEDSTYGRVLVVGLLNTLLVAFVSIFLATLIGFLVGVGRLSKNGLVRLLSVIYIETFRNVPLLLQIMFWYFGVLRNLNPPRQANSIFDVAFLSNRGFVIPSPVFLEGSMAYGIGVIILLIGLILGRRWQTRRQMETGMRPSLWPFLLGAIVSIIIALYALVGWPFELDIPALKGFNFKGGINLVPEFLALTFALSVYTAAFIAEIVRAGIQSVSHGQTEAGRALGMPSRLSMRLIIIPQAMRVIIPPLTSQYLNLTKNSSLAVAIAYPDIVSVFAGTALNQVGQAVEIIFITMLIYLGLSLLTSLSMNFYNNRVSKKGAQ